MAIKRLQKELKDLEASPLEFFAAGPINSDMFKWRATIIGPRGTPYEGGVFLMDINLPADYPFKAPKMTLVTKIYHPNIHKDGKFACHMSMLCDSWSPAYTIRKCLMIFVSMLMDPDPTCCAENDIGTAFKVNPEQALKTAREWTAKYAQ